MAERVSTRPWSRFSAADYTAEQFCRAALIDQNPAGAEKTKQHCKLPVREPDGTLNRNALAAAAAVLAGARGGLRDVSADEKRRAARALLRLYRQADLAPPESLTRLARG